MKYQESKALVREYFDAMENAAPDQLEKVLSRYVSSDYELLGVHPFNEQKGPDAVVDVLWRPLFKALTPIQRRQDIFFAGTGEIDGEDWVISMGNFMGLLDGSWLGIPPTRKMAFLRYAEFNCVKNNKICKTAFFCDIISLMQQVGIQPLPIQTGASFVYPGPRTHDGLLYSAQPEEEGKKTLALVNKMVDDLTMLNKTGLDDCPPEVLAKTWREDMIWYGPAGIGASYTIRRYQEQHQYPFRKGLKDKVFNGHVARLAEGNYAGFFGWPNLTHSPAGGFMGMPASDKKVHMRVVDIYRRQDDKLAENWVFIDIPYWLLLQGVDVLERTKSIVGRV